MRRCVAACKAAHWRNTALATWMRRHAAALSSALLPSVLLAIWLHTVPQQRSRHTATWCHTATTFTHHAFASPSMMNGAASSTCDAKDAGPTSASTSSVHVCDAGLILVMGATISYAARRRLVRGYDVVTVEDFAVQYSDQHHTARYSQLYCRHLNRDGVPSTFHLAFSQTTPPHPPHLYATMAFANQYR